LNPTDELLDKVINTSLKDHLWVFMVYPMVTTSTDFFTKIIEKSKSSSCELTKKRCINAIINMKNSIPNVFDNSEIRRISTEYEHYIQQDSGSNFNLSENMFLALTNTTMVPLLLYYT